MAPVTGEVLDVFPGQMVEHTDLLTIEQKRQVCQIFNIFNTIVFIF